MGFLDPFAGRIYALMRIVVGFLFACHGAQKLFGVLGGTQADSPKMWIAGVIELLGGALVLVGFQTRLAAFICSGTMAVAYFTVHQGQGLLPILNRGELAAVYCGVFLAIAARGAGPWSVDGERD